MAETGLGIKDILLEETPLSDSGIIPTFREQVFGSEPNIAKFNDEGFFMGASTFATAPFKVTYAGSVTASDITLTGGILKAGQTDYNTGTGYWLGTVSGTPKFSIGNGSTKYVTWDGTALTIRGTLNADDITAGTLTGRTVKAVGTSGVDVWMNSSNGRLEFYYASVVKGFLSTDSSGNMNLDADNLVYITATNAGDDIFMSAGDNIAISSQDIYLFATSNVNAQCDGYNVFYNDDNDNSDCTWYSNSVQRMELQQDGDLIITGNFSAANFDFAEFFESVNGKSVPFGTSVVLVGEMIRPATTGEIPFGVVSATAGVVLNNGSTDANNSWGGKYLTNHFGEIITEEAEWWSKKIVEKFEKPTGQKGTREKRINGWSDETQPPKSAKTKMVTRKKINPEWNESKKFVPRKNREEWNAVGLVGRVRLIKGQPVAPHWIKLKDVSETVEEWLIR